MQTFFLFMPGTTPGIFLFIVFGTTSASRKKVTALVKQWSDKCLPCLRRKRASPAALTASRARSGQITVERSLTITSANRAHTSRKLDKEDLFDSNDIWMNEIPRNTDSAMSLDRTNTKPLPLAPPSKFRTIATYSPRSASPEVTGPALGGRDVDAVGRRNSVDGLSRTTTNDTLRVADDYPYQHSDDSGPILPIQRPEVRFARDVLHASRGTASNDRHRSKSFSRPRT